MYPEVEKIDLSNNDITDVKDNIFSENLNLIRLDLSGNKNIIIPSFSTLIISDSIKQLSLADCNIEELPYLLFDGVQNVETIDISRNPLTVSLGQTNSGMYIRDVLYKLTNFTDFCGCN